MLILGFLFTNQLKFILIISFISENEFFLFQAKYFYLSSFFLIIYFNILFIHIYEFL